MSLKRAFLVAFFLGAVWSTSTLAGGTDLKLGQFLEGNLDPGQTQSFVVSLADGDYALIRRTETARDGEIIVALIEDSEATLKYFRREGAMVRLDPANRAYDPQRYAPSQVRIQGKLSGILRRYY